MAEQTIQFDEPIKPHRGRTLETGAASSGVDLDDGIVFSRAVSQGRRSSLSRVLSRDRDGFSINQEAGIRHPGDARTKQVFKGTQLFFLAYQSIGVVYGDIATSPLYVYSSTFLEEPSYDDLVGVLSLIIWSLLIMVTLKYAVIILNADNEGEGGTFSCYSLLSRYANITNRDRREEPMVKIERYQTNDLHPSNRRIRKTIEQYGFFKGLLKVMGVFAVTMVMSDGVLTPAQSVLGAVQGLDVIVPDINYGTVVGTTCGILALLFLIQPFGTTRIGVAFAPIIIFWLAMLASFGIYNLVHYDASVFKAFNPGEAFSYLVRNGTEGWRSLGGVLLCFTGVEALFADLGAFSKRAIQLSWFGWALPCLLLTYIGQAAYISSNKGAYSNPVFNTVPPNCLIFSQVVAILAAIVASQAIITATFQLVSQIVKLSYFPQVQVKHTSKVFHNQLYVPVVNYLLCIGTIVVTVAFKNTTALGEAYGVCVMFVTFFDTQMTALTALIVWRIRPWMIALPYLAIALMDGAFLSSALTKVPSGAWVTITIASVLASFLILWRFGKEQQWRAENAERHPLFHYVRKNDDGELHLAPNGAEPGGEVLSITRGFGIFFDKAGDQTPHVFSQFVEKLVSKPEVTVFFHLRPLEVPTVPFEERYIVQKLKAMPGCYRVVARFGFMDEVVSADLASTIYSRIRQYIIQEHANRADSHVHTKAIGLTPPVTAVPSEAQLAEDKPAYVEKTSRTSSGDDPTEVYINPDGDSVPLSLARLERAYEHRVTYIVGKEEMHLAPKTKIWRLILLKIFLFVRENTRNKVANLKLPVEKLVEIGFVMHV